LHTYKVVADELRGVADALRDGAPEDGVFGVQGGNLLGGVREAAGHRLPPQDGGGGHLSQLCEIENRSQRTSSELGIYGHQLLGALCTMRELYTVMLKLELKTSSPELGCSRDDKHEHGDVY